MSISQGSISFNSLDLRGSSLSSVNVLATTFSPVDGQTIFFGGAAQPPSLGAALFSFTAIRDCVIVGALVEINANGVAGSGEAWSAFVRVNGAASTLIDQVSLATAHRTWVNSAMSVSLSAGDTWVIELRNPVWVTNPTTCQAYGYILFEY